jgi:hypothetical protein
MNSLNLIAELRLLAIIDAEIDCLRLPSIAKRRELKLFVAFKCSRERRSQGTDYVDNFLFLLGCIFSPGGEQHDREPGRRININSLSAIPSSRIQATSRIDNPPVLAVVAAYSRFSGGVGLVSSGSGRPTWSDCIFDPPLG